MNAPAEKIVLDDTALEPRDAQLSDDSQDNEFDSRISSEFALKMINAVKSMNNGEITHHEMVNSFSMSDELRCLYLFIKALPYNPIAKIYPEVPFLFFRGVPMPQAFDISEEMAHDIETFMKGQNSEYYTDLRLHDLEQPYLDAYESGIRIYNDMVEKTRDSYHASVKRPIHLRIQFILRLGPISLWRNIGKILVIYFRFVAFFTHNRLKLF